MPLKDVWLNLHKKVSSLDDVQSGMNCIANCNASCCPRKGEAGIIGKFVIFLPFELDYIRQEIPDRSIPSDQFNEKVITKDGEISINWTENCPFLDGYKCSIYSHRPLDCRSFPLLAYHGSNDQITLEVSHECPEHHMLRSEYIQQVQMLWNIYKDHLPEEWWQFLYSLDESS